MRTAQRISAYCLPLIVFLALAFDICNLGSSSNLLYACVVLIGMSIYLGVFMYRRSQGREGKFVTVRIGPGDDEATQQIVDAASLLCAGILMASAVVFPFV